MRTDQALFSLGIELGIPRVRPWKELLATEAQATLLTFITMLLMQIVTFSQPVMGDWNVNFYVMCL